MEFQCQRGWQRKKDKRGTTASRQSHTATKVNTYSFVNNSKLLELLSQRRLLGVPCQATTADVRWGTVSVWAYLHIRHLPNEQLRG